MVWLRTTHSGGGWQCSAQRRTLVVQDSNDDGDDDDVCIYFIMWLCYLALPVFGKVFTFGGMCL